MNKGASATVERRKAIYTLKESRIFASSLLKMKPLQGYSWGLKKINIIIFQHSTFPAGSAKLFLRLEGLTRPGMKPRRNSASESCFINTVSCLPLSLSAAIKAVNGPLSPRHCRCSLLRHSKLGSGFRDVFPEHRCHISFS